MYLPKAPFKMRSWPNAMFSEGYLADLAQSQTWHRDIPVLFFNSYQYLKLTWNLSIVSSWIIQDISHGSCFHFPHPPTKTSTTKQASQGFSFPSRPCISPGFTSMRRPGAPPPNKSRSGNCCPPGRSNVGRWLFWCCQIVSGFRPGEKYSWKLLVKY